MGVPGADDIMLNYQSTSFHDAQYVRQLLNLRPSPEFEKWLHEMRIVDANGRLSMPSFDQSRLKSATAELLKEGP
jgi:ethanolamine ammonia-lyase large subunit